MDLLMHIYRRQRQPDWPAAAVAGLAAGAVLMVLELLWLTWVAGASPWAASHMIAAIVMGPDTLQSSGFSLGVVAVALLAHYVLGSVFGLVFAAIVAPLHLDARVVRLALAGAVFGVALYLLNFYGMVRFFPWFVDWRGTATLVNHVIFGITAAFFYWKLDRHGADRPH
jgi:ribose/xylose/arabinose/galactoside ABC-type transport system permease subunit